MKKKLGFNFSKEVISKLQKEEMMEVKGGEGNSFAFTCDCSVVDLCVDTRHHCDTEPTDCYTRSPWFTC